uniref:Uncharacterized protein n=1 Tax=Arundo donax TaxID=35708 RepID=A0A0A8Y0L8_ARUDO
MCSAYKVNIPGAPLLIHPKV